MHRATVDSDEIFPTFYASVKYDSNRYDFKNIRFLVNINPNKYFSEVFDGYQPLIS